MSDYGVIDYKNKMLYRFFISQRNYNGLKIMGCYKSYERRSGIRTYKVLKCNDFINEKLTDNIQEILAMDPNAIDWKERIKKIDFSNVILIYMPTEVYDMLTEYAYNNKTDINVLVDLAIEKYVYGG